MANKLEGSTDQERFSSLCQKTHKEQVVWFLNAYWVEHQADADKLWDWCHKAVDLDLQNHEAGSGLDELNAHRLLEHFDETMTVREMRESLRATGAISASARPKSVPITHILVFKYKADWKELINRTQGDNREEMEEAQRMLDSVVAAFKEADARAQEARQKEAEAREAEAPFKAAQEEVEAALAEVHREEAEYNGKIEDCKTRSESGGVVSRNKAKNELAQLLAEDPLPLRKARITLEAAQKRAEKARAPFEAKTKAAVEARTIADAAVQEAREQVAAAEAYLDEVKSRPGQPYGSLWWIDRELHEQKKYLPESKGGIRK